MKNPEEQGMGSTAMDSMVRMLAEAPENERRAMIKSKLTAFSQQPETERKNGMKAMIQAAYKLDQDSIRKLTLTRMESLAEDFDPGVRQKLMASHMFVLMALPKEQMNKELNSIASVMGKCHESCRMKDMATMKELMMLIPSKQKDRVMELMPEGMRKALME